jgi:hypothetical protein
MRKNDLSASNDNFRGCDYIVKNNIDPNCKDCIHACKQDFGKVISCEKKITKEEKSTNFIKSPKKGDK